MNRYHSIRRVISERKFERIFDNNLHSAGVCTIYRGFNHGWVNSLMAVKINGIIYAKFATRRQSGSQVVDSLRTQFDIAKIFLSTT